MKRLIVIGCPGSGKSCFSRELNKLTGIPLCHLDMLYWNRDRTMVERSVFLERLDKILTKDRWIIDGNYASTMELRMRECDTVFFLDIPVELCLLGIESRMGKPRSDIPWVEESADEAFVEYVKSFEKENRPMIISLLQKYHDKEIFIFKSREEADAYLNKLRFDI